MKRHGDTKKDREKPPAEARGGVFRAGGHRCPLLANALTPMPHGCRQVLALRRVCAEAGQQLLDRRK